MSDIDKFENLLYYSLYKKSYSPEFKGSTFHLDFFPLSLRSKAVISSLCHVVLLCRGQDIEGCNIGDFTVVYEAVHR